MTIIVTGAAGFIGSNLIKALNQRGETDIIAVDHLTHLDKFNNLVDCDIDDYLDKAEFIERYQRGEWDSSLKAVFHQGACSDTMQADGLYMMENNFRYSRTLLERCIKRQVPFLYASSAAVYGQSETFVETRTSEQPLNIYAHSKFLFDQYVRRRLPNASSQIVGLRYFNVYGPHEAHKGELSSIACQHFNQFRAKGHVKLFGAYHGYAAGQQMRDFVSVEDVIKVNGYFFEQTEKKGIFNVGTGRAQSFNDVAATVINTLRRADGNEPLPLDMLIERGLIEYTPFPSTLRGKYQCFTQADLTQLRAAGYKAPFLNVEQGVARYVHWLIS